MALAQAKRQADMSPTFALPRNLIEAKRRAFLGKPSRRSKKNAFSGS